MERRWNIQRIGIHKFPVRAFHLQICICTSRRIILQKIQKLWQQCCHIRNSRIGICTRAVQTACFNCGRLDFTFRQSCALRQHSTRFITVQAATGKILHTDTAGLVVVHQPRSCGKLTLWIEAVFVKPVEQIFFRRGGLWIERRPRAILISIPDEAAEIEGIRLV